MKNKNCFLLHLCVLLVLVSCNKNEVKKDFFANGRVKTEIKMEGNVRNGFYKEYYENGNLKLVSNFENDIQNGETILYFDNGKKEKEIFFKNGIQEGKSTFYYENGVISEVGNVKNGKKNGSFTLNWEDGVLKSKLNFVNDEIQGEGFFYNKKGQLKYKINFKDSSPINWNSVKTDYNFDFLFPNSFETVLTNSKEGKIALIYKSSSDIYKPNVNVVTIYNSKNMTLPSIISENMKELKSSYSNLKIIEQTDEFVDFQIEQEGLLIRGCSSFRDCANNEVLILSTLSLAKSYEIYTPIFNLMKESFTCRNH